MIIAEIGGGLGNQLNIYATARALSMKTNHELKLDTSFYNCWPKRKDAPREFQLDKFKFPVEIASKKETRRYLFKTRFRHINKFFRKFRLFEKNVLEEGKDFNSTNFFQIDKKDFYLRGYFGEEYFRPIKDILIGEVCLKEEYKRRIDLIFREIKTKNSVSINVRRGDLIDMNAYILPVEYYKEAVKIINSKVKNPQFYVFSDDILWCKENLNFLKGGIFVEGNEAYEDLELMKNCKHNILANSALSWWAAYLNKNKNKIVICPEYFLQFPQKDLTKYKDENPREWVRVRNEIRT